MEPPVDLNLLWTLKVLLEERNVTRAAERLNMTQSALSHRLRKLRDLFEDPLFVQSSQGLMPTARAETVAEPLSDGLRQLHYALHAVDQFDPKTTHRTLRLAAVDLAEVAYLAPMMRALRAAAPDVDVVLSAPTADIFDLLEDGEVDLLFSPSVPDRAGMRQRFMVEHRAVVVVCRNHRAVTEGMTLDKYCALDHIHVAIQGARTSAVDEALAADGRSRRIALHVPRFAGAAFMVAQTELVLTAADRFASAASRLLPLTILPCPVEVPEVRIQMAWHERFDRDPAHRWFRDFFAEQFHGLPTPG